MVPLFRELEDHQVRPLTSREISARLTSCDRICDKHHPTPGFSLPYVNRDGAREVSP